MRRFAKAALLGSLALSATLAAAPAAHAQRAAVALPVEQYKLDNGLEVVLHEDHRTPVIAVNIWYHVGSKDEPAGKNGFAHLFEHVMFQGSRHVGEDLFFKYLERSGASDINGSTNDDRTNYFETVPSNQLELALWLESDRMAFLLDHVNQETFASQREVVLNERRQNYENAPYGFVHEFVRRYLFPDAHPYHRTTIGSPEDLNAATLDDVKSFFRTFYVPNNASLVIAGDLDKARVKELVSKYFAPIVRGADPPVHKDPAPVDLPGEKRLRVEADVELGRVQVSWVTPPHFAPGDAELDAVSEVLSSGKSSRLQKRLVRDLEIAQDVSVSQSSEQLASTFSIAVTLKKGKSPEQALAVVDEELAKLRAAPPGEVELTRARTQLLAQLVFGAERITTRGNLLNTYVQLTGDAGRYEKEATRYEGLTAADLQRAAATWLPEKKRVVTIVVPTPGAPRAGRLAEVK
jgi:predicted Zn-dependent peptidase